MTAYRISCRDCGNSRLLWSVPADADQAFWKRFYCKECRESGGNGRRIQVSTVTERTYDQGIDNDVLRSSAV